MAVGETLGQGFQNGSKNSLEMSSFRLNNGFRLQKKQTGPPDAKTNLRKSHFIMCHVTKYSTILGVFQQSWPGVSPTAILNEEKALGTRLIINISFFHYAIRTPSESPRRTPADQEA